MQSTKGLIMFKTKFLILFLVSFSSHLIALEKYTPPPVNSLNLMLESNQINTFNFTFPDMTLVDHKEKSQNLSSLFHQDNNVVFAFFFTHCVSICTTITNTIKSIQEDLPNNTKLVMISIDPDTDTPEKLMDFAKNHNILNDNWYLLTGEKHTIVELQKLFESYRGNKMNHTTSIFVKKALSKKIVEFKSEFAYIPQYFAMKN